MDLLGLFGFVLTFTISKPFLKLDLEFLSPPEFLQGVFLVFLDYTQVEVWTFLYEIHEHYHVFNNFVWLKICANSFCVVLCFFFLPTYGSHNLSGGPNSNVLKVEVASKILWSASMFWIAVEIVFKNSSVYLLQ